MTTWLAQLPVFSPGPLSTLNIARIFLEIYKLKYHIEKELATNERNDSIRVQLSEPMTSLELLNKA